MEQLPFTLELKNRLKAKEIDKHQLTLWGTDYFDLYLMHFPISIEYVDPKDKYPPEWQGLDGKVHPSKR